MPFLQSYLIGSKPKKVPRHVERLQQNVCYDAVFHALLAERRGTTSELRRATLSKSIRKHLRRALREQRNGRIEHALDEFKDLDCLIHHARAPVHPCFTKKDEKCPGPDEFATFWKICLHPKLVLNCLVSRNLAQEIEATCFRDIKRFTMLELQDALKHFRRNKRADSNGIVAECFVYGRLELHEHLLRVFNLMLVDGDVEEKWKQTTFSMIPKTRNLINPRNWRPLAILNITYKILAQGDLAQAQGDLAQAQVVLAFLLRFSTRWQA